MSASDSKRPPASIPARRISTFFAPVDRRRRAAAVPAATPITFLAQTEQDLADLKINRDGRSFYKGTGKNVYQGFVRAIQQARTAGHDEDLHLFYQNMKTALGVIGAVDGITKIFSETLQRLERKDRLLLPPRPRTHFVLRPVPAPAAAVPLPIPPAILASEHRQSPSSIPSRSETAASLPSSSLVSEPSAGSSVSSADPDDPALDPKMRQLQERNGVLEAENKQLKEDKGGLERKVETLQSENTNLQALLQKSEDNLQRIMDFLKDQNEKDKKDKEDFIKKIEMDRKQDMESLAKSNQAQMGQIIKEKDEVIKLLKDSIKEKEDYIGLLKSEKEFKKEPRGGGGGTSPTPP